MPSLKRMVRVRARAASSADMARVPCVRASDRPFSSMNAVPMQASAPASGV